VIGRAGALLLALAATGCVTQQRDDVTRARQAYALCVDEHPASHAECEALRDRLLAAQQRYEADAQRAWGCDPSSPDCPPRR
jgi:hypothetical protein